MLSTLRFGTLDVREVCGLCCPSVARSRTAKKSSKADWYKDCMSYSTAGVGNIMAYSWFSHCEKYLKALEFEKRFMKKQKVVLMETLA